MLSQTSPRFCSVGNFNMASSRVFSLLCSVSASKPFSSPLLLLPVRSKTHIKLATKKRINPFVQKRTDLIKKLVIALVKHERIQTTLHKAKQLQKYGDLLIALSQRRSPPPYLDMIENGFVLTEREAHEKMVKRRIVNRRSKKVVIPPQTPSEQEFLIRCKKEASNMLLGDTEALEKLYGPLKDRYNDKYGAFVRIIRIPNTPNSPYPNMAYVEFVDNNLPPLPELPVLTQGRWAVYRGKDVETEKIKQASEVRS